MEVLTTGRGLGLTCLMTLGLAAGCSQPDTHTAPPSNQAAAPAPQPAATPPPSEAQPAPAAVPPPPGSASAGASQPRAAAATATTRPPSAVAASTAPQGAAVTPVTAAEAAPAPAVPAAPKPEPPPVPRFREVTIPAGTSLSVTVLSTLGSKTSKVEDPVHGALAEPVVVSGRTTLPKGTEINGTVLEVKESGRVKGRASIVFRFERLLFDGETYRIQMARVSREAGQNKGDDVKKGGLGAGLGAVVGGIAGGGTGAAIGAVAGGTSTVLATKGREVEIPPGTVVTALVQSALTVRVPMR